MVEFRVLGDLQVWAAGSQIELGSVKQRTVLAALVIEADRYVSAEALIDRVWEQAPPNEVRSVLYTYIARLRRQLADAGSGAETGRGSPLIVRQSTGYRLDVPPEQVDVHLLRRLCGQARETEEPQARQVLLHQAVELWRGQPLAGLPGGWAARVRETLNQQYVGVLAEWAVGELDENRFGPVTDRLTAAVEQFPLAESLIVLLMRAFQLSGRRAEALDQYARSRQRISEELGVEPGADLRELHRLLLRDDTEKQTPVAPPVRKPAVESSPARAAAPPDATDLHPGCHLPADLSDFIGCETEIRVAQAALTGSTGARTRIPVVVLSGPGGVGKTALSIHIAHLLRTHYPDGQIFVGLQGHREEPGGLFDRVLRAIGVPNAHRLLTPEDKVARYRAAISGRRFLLVLDDAPSAEEIRELVPGSAGTALIISSRARLTTLSGACHVELRFFTEDESLALLRRIIGETRVAAEPDPTKALVDLSGGMPLALRISGARLAARPHWPISRLVGRMGDERRRLDEMTADGLAVRVSIAVGYAGLSTAAQQAFRLVGFLGVARFGPWLAAGLLDSSDEEAEDLLEYLFDARLVEVLDGRYRMHDLVRLYAQELATEDADPRAARDAVVRALWIAVAMVERAGQHTLFAAPQLPINGGSPSGRAAEVTDPAKWLVVEGDVLVSLVERAAALGFDDAACALANALMLASFTVHNELDRWGRTHTAALAAAQAAGNVRAEAVIHCGIARLRCVQDRVHEAQRSFQVAVRLFQSIGDEKGAAMARVGLGRTLADIGPYPETVPLLEQALSVVEELGEHAAAAEAAYSLGVVHRELGNDEVALGYLELAASRCRGISHWRGEAVAVRGIGLVRRAQGRLAEAQLWLQRAHDLMTQRGDVHLMCYTAQSLAKAWIRLGEPERARKPLEDGLAVCRERTDRFGIALIRRTLGEMQLAAGRPDAALPELRAACEQWREIGHQLGEARTLRDVGAAHALAGDCDAAHAAWRAALEIFTAFGTREAAELDSWRRQWNCDCPAAVLVNRTAPAAAFHSSLASLEPKPLVDDTAG